jgi:uncharacterized protein YkwD
MKVELATRYYSQPALLQAILVFASFCSFSCGQSVEESEAESLEALGAIGAPSESPDAAAASQYIIELTNEFRQQQGLKALGTNSNLNEAAQYFAGYMARTDKYGHYADGSRASQRASRFGYEYCIILENIAYQYNSRGYSTDEIAQELASGWKQSPGHRKNMLDPDVTDTGVAVAQSDRTGYWYAVQLFGRPQSASIEFHITNQSEVEVSYTIGDRTFQLPPTFMRTHMRCRSTKVDLQRPGAGGNQLESIQPQDGSRYAVTGVRDRLEVTRTQ